MASSRVLTVNLVCSSLLVTTAVLELTLSGFVGVWFEGDELTHVLDVVRLQSCFLAVAACAGIAAFNKRSGTRLVSVVSVCLVFSGLAAVLTAVTCLFRMLVLGNNSWFKLIHKPKIAILFSLICVDAAAFLASVISCISCAIYIYRSCHQRHSPQHSVVGPDGKRRHIPVVSVTMTEYSPTSGRRSNNDIIADDELTPSGAGKTNLPTLPPDVQQIVTVEQKDIVMADGMPMVKLPKQPPGTVYSLPPGSLVIVQSE